MRKLIQRKTLTAALAAAAVLTLLAGFGALEAAGQYGNVIVGCAAVFGGAMAEGEDGILRHHLLQFTLSDGTVVPSMALAAAQMFRDYMGQAPIELPPRTAAVSGIFLSAACPDL